MEEPTEPFNFFNVRIWQVKLLYLKFARIKNVVCRNSARFL